MKTYIETWDRIFSLNRSKRVFIAATNQNVGKTTVSLGLIAAMKSYYEKVGFIKPVGQRYLIESGCKVDEDSVLMERIFNFKFDIKDMSPVAVDRGYTERFLDGDGSIETPYKIKEAFRRVAENNDLVIIEGTGHAGVGSVFDLSNATVAKLLDSRVILISRGGIGNPIDEIMLNKAVFDQKGVKLAGIIVNKVLPEKYDKVNKYVRMGLSRLGIPVLGVIPYQTVLAMSKMKDFREELKMHVLCGQDQMSRPIKKIFAGAMDPKEAFKYLEDNSLVITSGNRTDFISLLIKIHTGRVKNTKKISGIILSGGSPIHRAAYQALKKSDIPVLVTNYNAYDVVAKIHDMTVKIKSIDSDKVTMAIDLVKNYVDIPSILRAIN